MSGVTQFRAQRALGWRERMARRWRAREQLPSPPVEGSLTRMVGLALEASGCQAAVGDVCDLLSGDGSRVEAEVVGFAGDKLFLMPTGEVHGLAPERARRFRASAPAACASGPDCWAASSTAPARRSTGSGRSHGDERVQAAGPDHQSAGAPSHRHAARRRRALHQFTADRRPRPAHRPVRRLAASARSRAARHDGALHQRRRHRRRPDRRTRPRSEGIRRAHSRARRPAPLRGRGVAGRQSAADAPARRVAAPRPSPNISASAACTCCSSWIR